MIASEGMILRKKLKIRLPQVRSTMELIGAESKKGLGQIFPSAVEEGHLRKLGSHCSGRVTGSANSYGCNQQSSLQCKSGSTAPGREKRTSDSKCEDNCSSQLETVIADEPKVEYVLAHAGKRECSMGLDGRKVKMQRINSTVMESLNCESGRSSTSCKEKGSPKMSKWEKSGVESVVTHADKGGPIRGLDGLKGKKQTTDSSVTQLLNSEGGPTTTSCKGKRISVMDKLQKSTDVCSGHTKMFLVDKSEGESVGACVGDLGLEGQKGKRQIIDNRLTKECTEILKKLMTHSFGWVFNLPVDPVKLKIPDYFCIISEPMDLGTIKYKLEKKLYLDTKAFASDVRLTFSNAMRYNPPGNDIHIMASKLNIIFESLWKSLQAKWGLESSRLGQKPISNERLKEARNLRRGCPKENALPCPNLLPRISISSTLRSKMRKDLIDISKGKISSNLLDCLRRFGLIGQHEEIIQADIDAFDDDKLSEWHRVISRYLDSKSTPSVPVKNHCGRSSIQKDLHNDSDRFSRTGNYACRAGPRNPDPLANVIDGLQMSMLDPYSDGIVSVVDDGNVQLSACPATPVRAVACGEGWEAIDYDGQMSPEKALRAAMLKRRFADTIARAKQNTLLCNGEKGDSKKMQQEKEILEKKQQEAKIRVATEAALRKSREAELKMQREREREAARIALEKMEKTVVIYENLEILKDIEMMACRQVFGSSIGNPLKMLGLSLKADYTEEEGDVMIDLNEDVEEGEIF
ncbi:Bromodomain [Macleaya cordata]|uniref:Bromodomain n=1 Tax=Macleaya cordata TaxID=56857 RepID=A0A200R9E7_MACCD|nr:Bromodomain [Macleaya cordata]